MFLSGQLTKIMSNSAAVVTLLVGMAAQPLAAEEGALALQLNDLPARQDVGPLYVESHDVLVLDVSGSMEDAEIFSSFQGVAGHYLSKEAIVDYKNGICTAVTPVFFGTRAVSGATHIVCNEEDANAFLDANLNRPNLAAVRGLVGGNTYPIRGLEQAALVYESEKAMNIEPRLRRVVLVGDEVVKGCKNKCPLIETLSSKFGATVSALGLGHDMVRQSYQRYIVTPRDSIQLVTGYGNEIVERPIAAGVSFRAQNADEAKTHIQTILTLSGY